MLKILHLDTGRTMRGGQWQLRMLARGLREHGHWQMIACPERSPLEAAMCQESFPALPLFLGGLNQARAILKLHAAISLEHPEIIHAHDGRGQTLSWLASARMPVRRIASRRVAFAPRREVSHYLKYRYTCHGIIATSQFIRGLLIESGILDAKIKVIPDGIDLPEILPDAEERLLARRRFGLDPGNFVIGHAGAFTKEKGQEVAIQAFERLPLSNARLLLAGDGPTLPMLKERYNVHDPQGRIRLLGYLDDLTAFMNCLDLFIMPSLSEGLGSSALIAMAHAVPVVATRVGGLPEIVEDGVTGWLVAPSSASDLAEGISKAAEDAPVRLQRGAQARKRAGTFTSDIMTERTETFYRQLLSRG